MCVCVCVVSVIVKGPVLQSCVVDGCCRNHLYYCYYYDDDLYKWSIVILNLFHFVFALILFVSVWNFLELSLESGVLCGLPVEVLLVSQTGSNVSTSAASAVADAEMSQPSSSNASLEGPPSVPPDSPGSSVSTRLQVCLKLLLIVLLHAIVDLSKVTPDCSAPCNCRFV